MIIIIKQYKVSVDNLKERVFFLKIKKKKIYPGGKLVVGYIYIYIYASILIDGWLIYVSIYLMQVLKILSNLRTKNFFERN